LTGAENLCNKTPLELPKQGGNSFGYPSIGRKKGPAEQEAQAQEFGR
jgi:hypothetical protein